MKTNKNYFFKKAIEITFKDKDLSISSLIKQIQTLFEEYEAHYRAYINTLEPEKIKYKFDEEHNNYLKEFNSILADVHNKIIFIPIAFIFGASQLTTGTFGKGLMIIIGMFVFSLLVTMFLSTHNSVLKILKETLAEKKKFYEQENPALYNKFKSKIIMLEILSKK